MVEEDVTHPIGAVGAKGSMACTHHLGNVVLPKDKLAGLRVLMRRAAAEGRKSRERAMLTSHVNDTLSPWTCHKPRA